MRVKGFLSSRFRPPAPLVEALINFPPVGKRHIILLIDTGASVTSLLDGDASRFGITMDYASKHLKLASRKVVGIGGMAELVLRLPSILGRDIINRYSLLFSASRGEVYLER